VHGRDCRPRDADLVQAAAAIASRFGQPHSHTVGAAARSADGRVFVGMNVYHFTGGPCAELVVIGAAAAQGVHDLRTIVAVADRERGLLPPCGRCRQVLFDYFPDMQVLVGPADAPHRVPIADLLPGPYVWVDHPRPS
jgi:cytidine deaminase